jgi:urease accessory protein
MALRIARLSLATLALLALPAVALAHSGSAAGMHHGSSFIAGFGHPFTGLDHLVMMIAVGIWSAMAARRIWLAPAAFAGMLGVGALLGMLALAWPGLEAAIAASLLAIGLLLLTRAQLSAVAGAALVGGFALFHGFAHGAELSGTYSAAAALSGMLLGTLLLHVAGIAAGLLLRSRDLAWSRALGGAIALFGASLITGML